MFSVNKQAMKIVGKIIQEHELLNVGVERLANGSTVIDMGVNYPGGWEAARNYAEVTLGGLGRVQYGIFELNGLELPQVEVYSDRPAIACLGSQLSGWPLYEVKTEAGIVPLISGPVRALAKKDKFAQIVPYQDRYEKVVAVLQGRELPDAKFTAYLARECNVPPENVYVLAAATGSLVGFVNVAARTLETSIWRLHQLGLDINSIISAWGKAPVPPVTQDEYTAMVRVNTYTYYGGEVGFLLECRDADIAKILPDITLSPRTTAQYGIPFGKLLQDAGGDIFHMTEFVHSVTKVNFYNRTTGNTFQWGAIDYQMLLDCLGNDSAKTCEA